MYKTEQSGTHKNKKKRFGKNNDAAVVDRAHTDRTRQLGTSDHKLWKTKIMKTEARKACENHASLCTAREGRKNCPLNFRLSQNSGEHSVASGNAPQREPHQIVCPSEQSKQLKLPHSGSHAEKASAPLSRPRN